MHTLLEKAITKSQHCQRNWDLSKDFPEDDLQTILWSVTQCPSKQNKAFYRVHTVLDRDIIEDLYDTTDGFGDEKNTQMLANLVLVFEAVPIDENLEGRNSHERALMNKGPVDLVSYAKAEMQLLRDQQMAVGVAAGYANLTATQLGYSTGCCGCFEAGDVKKILFLKNEPLLLMGIGHPDPNKPRRQHHIKDDFIFSTRKKQPIEVITW